MGGNKTSFKIASLGNISGYLLSFTNHCMKQNFKDDRARIANTLFRAICIFSKRYFPYEHFSGNFLSNCSFMLLGAAGSERLDSKVSLLNSALNLKLNSP